MKIIPICSADRERLGINRFRRFCGFGLDFGKRVNFLCFGGWFGEGAGKGKFFVGRIGALGWVDFSEVGFRQTVRNVVRK